MKRFEAFLGNEWKSWAEDKNTTIVKKSNLVTVSFTHSQYGDFKTIFNLSVLPAYTIAQD